MHVLLTCPTDLLCNIGLHVAPGEHADARAALGDALDAIAEVVIRDGEDRFAVQTPDPIDAVIAVRTLVTELPELDIELVSFVASSIACEMLLEPTEPAHGAWLWLAARLDGPRPDPRRGCCFVSHFGQPFALEVPPAIAEQALPAAELVLWSTASVPAIVAVTQSPFVIGPRRDCHLLLDTVDEIELTRTERGWRVHGRFHLDNQPAGGPRYLQPGMVIQLEPPHAFVVLAVH